MKISKLYPWLVCLSAGLFFFYEFIQMTMLNSIGSEIMRSFSINAAQLGLLSSTYFVAIILFYIPAGILIDNFSNRILLYIAMSVSICGTIILATTHSIIIAGVSHFLSGIGHSFSFLIPLILTSRWFPPHRRAFVMSIVITIGMMGGIFAQTILTELTRILGWRYALIAIAALGILFLFIIYLLVRDYPTNYLSEQKEEFLFYKIGQQCLAVVKNTNNWLCGIYASLLNLPIILLGAIWGLTYFEFNFYLSKRQASYVTSLLFMGAIIGTPLMGLLANFFSRRKLMTYSAILALICILLLIFQTKLSLIQLSLLMLTLGIITSAQVLNYPIVIETNPKKMIGTAVSFASLLIMSSGVIFQPLFGYLIDQHSRYSAQGYSKESFYYAMLIIPVSFFICIVVSLIIKDPNRSQA
jgi:MFS family permease